MLKDVIDFVLSRTSLTRADALREINYAWREIYTTDDLPNSVFEITVEPIDNNARISLPWFVGEIRGVKLNRFRVLLNTPRPWYQDSEYAQSPYIWRLLGTSPLTKTIVNATTLDLTFTEPVTAQVVVTLIGPNDNGTQVKEQITFAIGDTIKRTTQRFVDLVAATKDIITATDLLIINSINEEIGKVPNSAYEAKNQVIQITDKCFVVCSFCRCFDILYKRVTPVLVHDETPVPFEEVLMAKTMEWIMLPKDGQENKAVMFGTKSRELLTQYNSNERSTEHKLDIATSKFETRYYGTI